MRSSRRSPAPGVALLGVATSIGLGIFAAALRTANAEPAEASVEIAGNIAFGIVLAAPAFLGLLRTRRAVSCSICSGGRSSRPMPVQAAEHALRTALGLDGVDDAMPERIDPETGDVVAMVALAS